MGNFRPTPLDQLPIPQAAAPTQYTPAKIDEPPSQQPPGAGAMGAGGKIADVASNFLTGWLKGKQQAEQKKLAMAQQNMEGLHYGFQIAQQNAAQVMNDPNATPDAKQKAEAARQAAWKAYLDGAEPYTEQPKGAGKSGGGKGKGGDNPIKSHLKQTFGAEDPHIFSQGAMALLRTTGPPSLPQKSSQEQVADLELKGQKRVDQKIDALVEARKSNDPQKIAAAEQDVRDAQGQVMSPKEKSENALAQAAADERAGKPQNDATKQQLIAAGYDPKPVMPNQFERIDPSGTMYVDSVDPQKGTLISSTKIGKSRIPPDQREEAQKIFKDNLDQVGKLLKQAHPDWSDEQVAQAKAEAMLSGQFGVKTTSNLSPIQAQTEVSKAINEVVANLPDDQKEKAGAVLVRAQGIGGGGYMFRDQLAQKGFWDKYIGSDTYYGMSETEASSFEDGIRSQARSILTKNLKLSHPKYTDEQIKQSVDELMGPTAPSPMDKTPDESSGGGIQPNEVTVVAPDGTPGYVKKSDVAKFLQANPGYKQQ